MGAFTEALASLAEFSVSYLSVLAVLAGLTDAVQLAGCWFQGQGLGLSSCGERAESKPLD